MDKKTTDVSRFQLPPACLGLRDQEAFISCEARAESSRDGSEDIVLLHAEGDHD